MEDIIEELCIAHKSSFDQRIAKAEKCEKLVKELIETGKELDIPTTTIGWTEWEGEHGLSVGLKYDRKETDVFYSVESDSWERLFEASLGIRASMLGKVHDLVRKMINDLNE